MDKRTVLVSFLIMLFLATSLAIADDKKNVEPIRIGVAGPMKALIGQNQWSGAIMAQDEINSAGGILVKGVKKPIKLVKIDTNEMVSVADAVVAVEKAASEVDFYIGTFRTESSLAVQDAVMKKKKILISCGGIHPELCLRVGKDYNKYKYFFRVVLNSGFHHHVLFAHLSDVAKVVRDELKIAKPKVAILADKLQWADPSVKALQDNAGNMGIEIVGTWRPSASATDLSAELAAIKATGAHIIFQVIASPMGVVLAKQWGELEMPNLLIGGNAWASSKTFWEATGGKAQYMTSMMGMGRVKLSAKTIPFFDAYNKRFNNYPGFESVTYDALYVLKGAIEKANTLDTEKLVEELEKTDYIGAYGRIAFYPRGHELAHDLKWGPGFSTWLVLQWLGKDKLVAVWPDGWEGIRYEGVEKYQMPPWVVKQWTKK